MDTSAAIPQLPTEGQDVIDRSTHLIRRGQPGADADVLQLSETVVPMPDASMRVLEFLLASVAIVVAIVLGVTH